MRCLKWLKSWVFVFGFILMCSCQSSKEKEISVLVVRGGHAYDTPSFENMCTSLEGVKADLVLTSHFFRMKTAELKENYDAVLFLNQNKHYEEYFWNKPKYMNLAKEGVGVVFLGFTLSSNPNWDEFHDFVGGKYFLKPFTPDEKKRSTYFPKIETKVTVLDKKHPVTKGLSDFTLTDAFYGKINIREGIHPLLGTDHSELSKVVVWTHQYKQSKVVYIMPGFTEGAFNNASYKKLISNSLFYVGTNTLSK